MTKYGFVISELKELDVPRILAENPEAFGVILIGPKNAAVIIRNEILGKFITADSVIVAGVSLSEIWGNPGVGLSSNLELCPTFDLSSSYRVSRIKHATIKATLAELQAAKAYRRRLKITVLSV